MVDRSWWPDWRGETCVVVASGPSASRCDLSVARGSARFISVNNSWELAPWSDALYACDSNWWKDRDGVPDFNGLKISQDEKCLRMFGGEVRVIPTERAYLKDRELIIDRDGPIGWGGNGGFQAVNVAVRFGIVRIVLVGFDMRLDLGFHWHGDHPKGLTNPQPVFVERWRETMDRAHDRFVDAGVEVLNASDVSLLESYRKVQIEEVFA